MSRIAHASSVMSAHREVVCSNFSGWATTPWCWYCGWNQAAHPSLSNMDASTAVWWDEYRRGMAGWRPDA